MYIGACLFLIWMVAVMATSDLVGVMAALVVIGVGIGVFVIYAGIAWKILKDV
jgi:hypothetical protein